MASSSLNTVLKALTRVGRSDSVYQVASADRINAIQDAIRLLVRGENIVAGTNVLKRSSDGYVILTGNAAGQRVSGSSGEYPFQLIGLVEATSDVDPTPITRVRVVQGQVNGEFPTGMGFDDDPTTFFKLDITDNTTIVVQATFDPDTLAITSRTCFESDDPDDSSIVPGLGTINFQIGFAQIQYDMLSNPIAVLTQNAIRGDITFELIYGAVNGAPAILPIATYGVGWIDASPLVAP